MKYYTNYVKYVYSKKGDEVWKIIL